MEIFILLIIGAVIILLISNFRAEVKKNMRILNSNVINLRKEMEAIKKEGIELPNKETQQKAKAVVPKLKPLEVSGQRLATQKTAPKKPNPLEKAPKKVAQTVSPKIKKEPLSKTKAEAIIYAEKTPKNTPVKPLSQPIKKQSPTKTKIDYEKVIGENWLNKIGIAILVIGIGFFVKYAIDKNWIGEIGRVAIGIGTGGLLIGIAHFLRTKYKAFSSVLIGGGISVMYYTISIAYHDYAIFNQKTAFGIMVLITLFSTIVSVLYDRKELAIIALIGAFTSPFMVQGETGNYVAFFTYIAILNTGMLALSYFKKWDIISKLALGFTVLFFGAWIITENMGNSKPATWGVVFATLFFVQFLSTSLIYNLIRKIKFTAWEFIQLSSITVLYYSVILYLLDAYTFSLTQGGFTLLMSLFFIGLALFANFKKGTDKALVYLLIGKAITFITLTGGLLFDGNQMTIYWGIEAVAILALGQYRNMKVLNNASFILVVITLFGIIRDWTFYFTINSVDYTRWVNPTLITSLFVVGSLFAIFLLLKRSEEKDSFFLRRSEYKLVIGSSISIVSYATLLFELLYQIHHFNYPEGVNLILWIFHLAIAIAGFIISKSQKSTILSQVFFFIGCIVIGVYLLFAQSNNFEILKDAISSSNASTFYYLHFLLTAGVIVLILFLRNTTKEIFEQQKDANWFLTGLSIIGLIIATVELDQIIGYFAGLKYGLYPVLRHTQTEGYTILWGLYSFILMLIGMKKKNKIMRILALVIFSATLLKLFIFDIRNISEAGKIIAFISLGVLLLVISFMYQKLRQLIVGDEINLKPEENQAKTQNSNQENNTKENRTDSPSLND